jgi:penicillin-binding protein 2
MIDSAPTPSRTRRLVLQVAIGLMFLVLIARLAQLQLFSASEFGKRSEENSVRAVVREPVRGYMLDRNGRLVVDVGPAYFVTVTPSAFQPQNLETLANILRMPPKELADRIAQGRAHSRFLPARVKRDIDFKTLAELEERLFLLPGVDYQVESKRTYPSFLRSIHLFGYVREISDIQLSRSGEIYRQGDFVGAAGLEASYEPILRGEKGFQFFSVNAHGQLLGSYDDGKSDRLSKEGFDLLLGLELGTQALAESLMVDHRGALVAVDPSDGSILAMVSKPDFDPSILSGLTPAQTWNRLNNDPSKPLFNRATMTRYPPGSTFKMVLAAAALQDGVIDEDFRITCTGGYRFGNRVFKDLGVHGSTNVVEAIQRSCNVFFYQLILRVGLNRWAQYARQFGFGNLTGVDINEETTGLIPTSQYYDRVYGKGRWTQGNLISLAIGQGEVGVSPLQMAVYAATLANGGTWHQPHAVMKIHNKRTNRFEDVTYRSHLTSIDARSMGLIREGMRLVVEAPGGTGRAARIQGVESAGKTGTAENPHGEDHAWYVGFAPFENPKIAVAIMLENAGFGGVKAAPIAGQVMERYLFGETRPRRPTPRPAPADTTQRITQLTRVDE